MRVLLISNFYPPDSLGGVQLYTHGIAQELQRRGVDVQVLCAGTWNTGRWHLNGISRDVYQGVPVRRIHLNWKKAPDPFRYLYDNPVVGTETQRLIEQFRPSVVHITFLGHLSASTLFAAKGAGIPVIVTLPGYWFICPRITLLHADGHICDANVSPWECTKCLAWGAKIYRWPSRLLPDAWLRTLFLWIGKNPLLARQRGLRGMVGDMADRRRVLSEAFAAADAILGISSFVKEVFARSGQLPAEQIRVHEWGLPARKPVQHVPKGPGEPLRVAYFGRVAPSKGIDVLIRAFKQVRGKARLYIYGSRDGGSREYSTELDRLCDGDNRIEFLGPYSRDEMGELLAHTDVVVVPSLWPETFCMAPREALMAGVPVIASRIGAIPEAVKHFENGLLYEPGDVHELALSLQLLLDKPALREQFAEYPRTGRTVGEECDELLGVYQRCRGGTIYHSCAS